MARRSEHLAAIKKSLHEAERQRITVARAQARTPIAKERAETAEQRLQTKIYAEARQEDVEAQNLDLDAYINALGSLLVEALSTNYYFDLDSPKPVFNPGELATHKVRPKLEDFLPKPPSFLEKLLRGGEERHALKVQEADEKLSAALRDHEQREGVRIAQYIKLREKYEEELEEIEQYKTNLQKGDPEVIVDYLTIVLEEASEYPDRFPRHARIAYVPESKQAVIELDLPPFTVIPDVKEYRYIKSKDEIRGIQRSITERRALYSSVIAQMALRTVHEIFYAFESAMQHIESIVFNGHVDSIDKGTGKQVRPCLITLSTTRSSFLELDLSKVDPLACLTRLNASVSQSPTELVPVRPVLEFNMVDPRFVVETDILSALNQRPNLMELTPTEFENLITNLFEKMGLETRLTQASRDGGVDCVAYNLDPILGGKVVIQAKRYKNTVGVSAVRDLYGTLMNEGASKGILVTTSGFGPSCIEFVKDKPIELLGGTNLLYLLNEHAGLEARIEPPEDWHDPDNAQLV